jgi:hypothetical protein
MVTKMGSFRKVKLLKHNGYIAIVRGVGRVASMLGPPTQWVGSRQSDGRPEAEGRMRIKIQERKTKRRILADSPLLWNSRFPWGLE